jgi:hypothetical protein
MNLTNDDLQAIKKIVDGAIDDSNMRTAAGFAEVDAKFKKVDERFAQIDKRLDTVTVGLHRIENKLNPTIEQVEEHEAKLARLLSEAA